jgi:hypothetical protein
VNRATLRIFRDSIAAAALCVAAYALLAAPLQRRAVTAQRRVASLQSELARTPIVTLSLHQQDAIALQNTRGLDMVRDASLLALDESRLYTRVMEIGRAHEVRVEQLQPIQEAAPRALPKTDGPPPLVAPEFRRVSTTLVGSYADVVGMLEDLQSGAGFVAIESVRLTPTVGGGKGLTRASVTTRHVGLRFANTPGGDPQ